MESLHCVALALFILLSTGCYSRHQPVQDQIVLKVNTSALSVFEFSDRLAQSIKSMNSLSLKDENQIQLIKEQIVKDYIVESLTRDWAKQNNVFVRKELLDLEVEKVKRSYPDELTFKKALADEGLVFSVWKDQLEKSLLLRIAHQKIRDSVASPSEIDLKKYFEENRSSFVVPEGIRIRQIVVKSEAQMDLVQKELKSGKKFEELAKSYSITPDSRSGGDVDWIAKGSFEPFDKLFLLNVGQRSEVFKSDLGFHLVEILAKRKSQPLSFAEASPKMVKLLREDSEKLAFDSWLEEQIKKSRIFKDEKLLEALRVSIKGV